MKDGAYLHEGTNKFRAVFLFTDIFGLNLVNSKLMADRFSKELGCDVWVPDLFGGEHTVSFIARVSCNPR